MTSLRAVLLLLLALVMCLAAASEAMHVQFRHDPQGGVSSRNYDWVGGNIAQAKTHKCALVCALVLDCTHWTRNGDAGNQGSLKRGSHSTSRAFSAGGDKACGIM